MEGDRLCDWPVPAIGVVLNATYQNSYVCLPFSPITCLYFPSSPPSPSSCGRHAIWSLQAVHTFYGRVLPWTGRRWTTERKAKGEKENGRGQAPDRTRQRIGGQETCECQSRSSMLIPVSPSHLHSLDWQSLLILAPPHTSPPLKYPSRRRPRARPRRPR